MCLYFKYNSLGLNSLVNSDLDENTSKVKATIPSEDLFSINLQLLFVMKVLKKLYLLDFQI